ncbi:MAG: putative Na+/H+ antiporter [Candidatus Didemnitutus sp.]|nr:putative Na+/H+ antiporter [Candidatus Didemnitutus sp.]
MKRSLLAALLLLGLPISTWAAANTTGEEPFPVPLTEYATDGVENGAGLWTILQHRVEQEPFNLVATVIFVLAIVHTFLTARFRHWAHVLEHKHAEKLRAEGRYRDRNNDGEPDEVSFWGKILHFFGEVEAVFGIWVIPLLIAISFSESWHTAEEYLNNGVRYTEPIFVVVIMAIAGSRPVLRFAEDAMARVARLGSSTPAAWWLAILTIGPILGSFITEPAAMTISALLLLENFYRFQPSERLKYATIGLLFVNVSVGGTLTHFAAPPVLMVAGTWEWGFSHMVLNFGWKAVVGILVANLTYWAVFRRELGELAHRTPPHREAMRDGVLVDDHRIAIPFWVTAVHIFMLFWTVFTAHYTALYMGGFLIFLAFTQATTQFQTPIQLRGPVLVGFFLAGLVIHGTLQQWWIEPVLRSLDTFALFGGATVLTAFNDNAAITYLASLVPGFSDEMKYAVVAGAVAGGGLTVIANAPNPAGQSILSPCFREGVAPGKLLLGALLPTLIMAAAFLVLP